MKSMHPRARIRRAFDDGRMFVVEDPETIPTASRRRSTCVGVPTGERLRKVSIISRPAGGEVRGYFRDEQTGNLHLTLPARPEVWPELDEIVQERLDAPNVFTRTLELSDD